MKEENLLMPIVFITGHGDVPTAVQAVKNGAFDFLEKPVDAERLIPVIEAACAAPHPESPGMRMSRSTQPGGAERWSFRKASADSYATVSPTPTRNVPFRSPAAP